MQHRAHTTSYLGLRNPIIIININNSSSSRRVESGYNEIHRSLKKENMFDGIA